MAKTPTAKNQMVHGNKLPIGIGLRHSGGMGQDAPKPLGKFRPVKYATQGGVKVGGKLI